MGGIFINYRGDDSDTTAALVDRELAARFGSDQVFLDSRSIPAGVDFADELLGRLRACSVLLVVMGPRWLTLTDASGRRRIDYPQDWVHQEIAEALKRGLRVIPVLLDGVELPTKEELPDDIAELSRRQYVPLRRRYTEVDLTFLVKRITETNPELAARRQPSTGGVPRQLPAAVTHFAGRSDELATLTSLLRDPGNTGGTVVISAVSGAAGVGKTALAVHWAHQVADRFPDGQLYVNLRGFDPSGSVLDPAAAVRRFLDALQVPTERVPVDLDAQAALYRSLLSGRRMLVVLDNARDTAQVRSLLPGAPGCLVLVTSRNQLAGLVAADGAHPIMLDLLTEEEAQELLSRRIGGGRTAAEPQAIQEIIARCARLPLALAIMAARAATHPQFRLRTLAAELREAGDRLDALTIDDPYSDARAVFSWSYRTLSREAAQVFRLLGLHPGPDLSAPAAASLAGLPLSQVRPLLTELARVNLIVEHIQGRYIMHDLLRAYATDLTSTIDPDSQRHAATRRILDHYLHTAHTAAQLMYPTPSPFRLSPPQPGTTPEHPTDSGQALAWFTTEHAVLLATVEHTAATGFDTHTWQLTWTLSGYLDWRGHWHDSVATRRAGVAAARRLADPKVQANSHRNLASAYLRLGRFEDTHTQLQHALDLTTQVGDLTGQAQTHLTLTQVWEQQGRHAEALEHAQHALHLLTAADQPVRHAHALNAAGWCHAQLGEHEQALSYCQQALTQFQELDDSAGQATTWDSIGYAQYHLGDRTLAIASYQHALHLFQDLGNRYAEAGTLTRLGKTHHATGNPHAARDAWQHALTILDDLHHPDAEQVRAQLAALDAPTPDRVDPDDPAP